MLGGVFYNCKNLSDEITIGEGTTLERMAFEGTGITKVTIGNEVNLVDNSFNNCPNINSVIIGNDVTINSSTFINCGTIESVSMGENIKISGSPFSKSNVEKATVKSLSEAGSKAFVNIGPALQGDIIINEGATTIGNQAFNGCSSITSVSIPSTITVIDVSAFYNCKGLKSLKLPAGLTTIGWRSIL